MIFSTLKRGRPASSSVLIVSFPVRRLNLEYCSVRDCTAAPPTIKGKPDLDRLSYPR